jgi:hypothetical protein
VPTIVVGDSYNLAAELDTNMYGAVYVWEYSSSTWTQTAKLVADILYNHGRFGDSVAIDGNTIVVGEPGSTTTSDNGRKGFAHVFTRSVGQTTWTHRARLTATDGAADDLFGSSVAIDGDTIVVGAMHEDRSGDKGDTNAGSAYVFKRDVVGDLTSGWTQDQKLMPASDTGRDNFGCSVDISGDTIAIGAYNDDDPGPVNGAGSAYMFGRDTSAAAGSQWQQRARLVAGDMEASAFLGSTVAINGDIALFGAQKHDAGAGNNANRGSVYIFTRDTPGDASSSWTQDRV